MHFRRCIPRIEPDGMLEGKSPALQQISSDAQVPDFLISGHALSEGGDAASSAELVAVFFSRSQSLLESAGFFASNRYMSGGTRPSSRMRPFFVITSLIGISRIFFSTASVLSVPAEFERTGSGSAEQCSEEGARHSPPQCGL